VLGQVPGEAQQLPGEPEEARKRRIRRVKLQLAKPCGAVGRVAPAPVALPARASRSTSPSSIPSAAPTPRIALRPRQHATSAQSAARARPYVA
jgi:hypothetical protein